MTLLVLSLVILALTVALGSLRHEARRFRRIPGRPGGSSPFDATSARQRVARVRGDYLAIVSSHSPDRRRRERLRAQVCRTVRSRAYFRHRTATDLPPASMGSD